MPTPGPVLATSSCVAASLLGDGALYVVLPVVYPSRGLTAMQVGLILSANRWTRLLTNGWAVGLLGRASIRHSFGCALLIGGLCSVVYGATTWLPLLVLARCVWGGCWSIIRLTGLLTVTDCVEAGLASESTVGQITGLSAGLTRLGSAFGMAVGGFACDVVGFENCFYVAGLLTMLSSPLATYRAFEPQPRMSVTASRHVKRDAWR